MYAKIIWLGSLLICRYLSNLAFLLKVIGRRPHIQVSIKYIEPLFSYYSIVAVTYPNQPNGQEKEQTIEPQKAAKRWREEIFFCKRLLFLSRVIRGKEKGSVCGLLVWDLQPKDLGEWRYCS